MTRDHVGHPVRSRLPGIARAAAGAAAAAIALWRAGVVRWWAFVAVLAGQAAFMFSNVMWWGCAITTVCFTVFAVRPREGDQGRTEL